MCVLESHDAGHGSTLRGRPFHSASAAAWASPSDRYREGNYMNALDGRRLAQILAASKEAVLSNWLGQQLALASRRGLTSETEMRGQFAAFLDVFIDALDKSDSLEADRESWNGVRAYLADTSARRARQGFTPSETATFVFSLKQPMFSQ